VRFDLPHVRNLTKDVSFNPQLVRISVLLVRFIGFMWSLAEDSMCELGCS